MLRRLERHLGLHIWSIQTRPLSANFELPPEHAARFTFKRLTLDEALAACENQELGMTEEFVRDAFERGDTCVGALENGNLAAYAWRTTTEAPVSKGLWIRLQKPGMTYGYKGFVLPEYRGMRLHYSNTHVGNRYFFDKGNSSNVAYIALHNLGSMKYASRDPDREYIGFAGYLSFGRHYWTFRTPKVCDFLSLECRRRPAAVG